MHNKPWFKAAMQEHGDSGHLHIEPHDLAPISNLILDSMESQGLPLLADMFSTGESPHGCGHVPRSHWKGNRTTAADYLVGKGPNLAILTETTVDKVFIEGENGNLSATSVQVIDKEGMTKVIKANKEVIVSGGAYCTPAVLMRSGIGAKDELAKHGIECKVDLPGVGKNLMDHLARLPHQLFSHSLLMSVRLFSSSMKLPKKALPTTAYFTTTMPLAKLTANGRTSAEVPYQPSPSVHSPTPVSTTG